MLNGGTTYYIVVWETGAEPIIPGETSVQLRIFGLFPPTVATLPATSISSTNVMFNATVNANGAATTAWFDYGITTNFINATAPQAVGNGSSNVNVSAILVGFPKGETHFFRVRATNVLGQTAGTNLSFKWNPNRPLVTNISTSGGVFTLQFTGAVHQQYLVLASTNLVDWSSLDSATEIGNGLFSFQDPISSTLSRRFYRVLAP
jgi:hypothetical protein